MRRAYFHGPYPTPFGPRVDVVVETNEGRLVSPMLVTFTAEASLRACRLAIARTVKSLGGWEKAARILRLRGLK